MPSLPVVFQPGASCLPCFTVGSECTCARCNCPKLHVGGSAICMPPVARHESIGLGLDQKNGYHTIWCIMKSQRSYSEFSFSPSRWIHPVCTEDCLPSTQWGLCGRLLRHEHIVTRLLRAVSARAKWVKRWSCEANLKHGTTSLKLAFLFHDFCNRLRIFQRGYVSSSVAP